MNNNTYPPIHEKTKYPDSFQRLDMLWERYPKYHEMHTFATLDEILEEHESYQKDFDEELQEEYRHSHYEKFLIKLSWMDLSYRQATRKMIERDGNLEINPYVQTFLKQFDHLDTDHYACFLFPESFTSQFFVIEEVCKRAESFYLINNLFPDEKIVHYLAVFNNGYLISICYFSS